MMTTMTHHPDDELLLTRTAGSLDSGASLVVASHVEGCERCRERVRWLEAVGGQLLAQLEPSTLAAPALARTLAAIDDQAPVSAPQAPAPLARPPLPAGLAWPRALRHCRVSGWRWLGPGVRWSRVTLPHDAQANVFLLRIGAGKMLPMHTHGDTELTQVLYGSFHDGRALFGPGDFDAADRSILHQPVVRAESECICLATLQGRVMFEGAVASWLGRLIGM